MKKSILALLLLIFILMGCGQRALPEPIQKVVVNVVRKTGLTLDDSSIKIACENATLDYNARKIVIEGAKNFGGAGRGFWIGNMEVKDNKIILELPPDAYYSIWIGKQNHTFPMIVK